jgi:hypothetical protein
MNYWQLSIREQNLKATSTKQQKQSSPEPDSISTITSLTPEPTSPHPVGISQFNICMPAGTYSVVFVVKAASPNGRPNLHFWGFGANDDSDACSNSVDSNLTGKTNSYLNTEEIASRN